MPSARNLGPSLKRAAARVLGAEPITLDRLDSEAVGQAVLNAKPEAIADEATAVANARFARNLDRTCTQTNRPRTEGTDALLAGARSQGSMTQPWLSRSRARLDGVLHEYVRQAA